MRYLDPKNDLTFKKVFGQHPHLLRSLLNALLPLNEGQEVVELEYLTAEMVPDLITHKHSIVDVRCRDNHGRQFLVEMQILWTDSFKQRVLFNASKAYVHQLKVAENFQGIQPVYALNFVNQNFEHDISEYYHRYALFHAEHPDRQIEGIELIFVELKKFKANNLSEKKLQVLWLRFLTEIERSSTTVSPDLLAVPEIEEAVSYLRESAFTEEELYAYDQYWDQVMTERTMVVDSMTKGEKIGLEKGRQIGVKEGGKIVIAYQNGQSAAEIAAQFEYEEAEVKNLLLEWGLLS